MTTLNQNKLEEFFKKYGWDLESTGPGRWRSGFSGAHGYYPMSIHLSHTILTLTVCPIIDKSLWDQAGAVQFQKILQLNGELKLVKLGIDAHGALCLISQTVAREINFSIFSQTLEVLGYYCDELSHILAFMGCDTELTC